MNSSILRYLLLLLLFLPFRNTAQILPFLDSNDPEAILSGILEIFGANTSEIRIQSNNSIDNAQANILNGKRYVYYNVNWFSELGSYGTDSYWSKLGTFAHEVGHHVKGHPLDSKYSNSTHELEADWWAGFALAKLGASLEQALQYLSTAPTFDAGPYPKKPVREANVRAGYIKANHRFRVSEETKEEIFRKLAMGVSPVLNRDETITGTGPGGEQVKCRSIWNEQIGPNGNGNTIDDDLTTLTLGYHCSVTNHKVQCKNIVKKFEDDDWKSGESNSYSGQISARLKYEKGVLILYNFEKNCKFKECGCEDYVVEHLSRGLSKINIKVKWE